MIKKIFQKISGKAPLGGNPPRDSSSTLIEKILENIQQEIEDRGWDSVLDLQQATYAYSNRPDQAKKLLPICNDLIEKIPDFDLPRVWHVTALFDLGRPTEAIVSFEHGIDLCKRKRDIFGSFAQDFFWNERADSLENFKILLAASIAGFKLKTGMFFGQCFLVQYLSYYALVNKTMIEDLKNCPVGFDNDTLARVVTIVTEFPPDLEIKNMVSKYL